MTSPDRVLMRRKNPSLATTLLGILLVTAISLPFAHALPAPYELTRQQIADFRRDGVIVVRGMLEGETLEGAIKAADKIQRSRTWTQLLFHKLFPVYRNLSFQTYRKHEALERVAFDSNAPTICAKLMGLDEECKSSSLSKKTKTPKKPRSLRLLKDAVMGFSKGDMGCDWHVDDKTFWPCEDSHNDSNNSNHKRPASVSGQRDAGINVWISLSPLNAEEGGGFAVALGSHNLTGKGKAGRIFRKARKAIASMGSQTTCALGKLEPTCQEYMEKIKHVYDLQPGDAIVHDRYIFHRPDPFKASAGDDSKNEEITKQRVTLRYMPSDATCFNNGNSIDGAAKYKNLKTGDPLWKAGEYFPQAWPNRLEAEAKASPRRDDEMFGPMTMFRLVRQDRFC